MNEYIRKTIIDIIKWGVVIAMAAVAFYIVFPKYYVKPSGSLKVRYNQITGTMDNWVDNRVFVAATTTTSINGEQSKIDKRLYFNHASTSTTYRKEDYWKYYKK